MKIVKPQVFGDHRGHFFESYRKDTLTASGIELDFVQDNQSMSHKNVLRGLHFQSGSFQQAKLVRVTQGRIMDVAVDIRKGSPYYGQYVSAELTAENRFQLLVPVGFAHGFAVLEDHTIVQYKCSNYYHQPSEGGLLWNDPEIGIDWGVENPMISEKDKYHPGLRDFESPFTYQG